MPRWWLRTLKVVLGIVVALFVWRALETNWDAFRSLEMSFHFAPPWILASLALTLVTYAIQIGSWRAVLDGWRQRIPFGAAARAWCLANLGRYVPGKVWSVAGLVVLARGAGAAPGAAAASAIVVQALGLSTGAIVVVATTHRPGVGWALVAAAVVGVGTLLVLSWEWAVSRIDRALRGSLAVRSLPLGSAVAAGALTLASWVTYGLAFWCLARGMGIGGALTVSSAAGSFALAYLIGLMAVVVPGGLGVREVAMVGQLTPLVGGGPAIALSVASRLLLTVAEAGAGGLALLVRPLSEEEKRESSGN